MSVRRIDPLPRPRSFDPARAIVELLRLLDVPSTESRVRRSLTTHPDHPGTASVLETLDAYGIDAAVGRMTPDELDELDRPVLAHLRIGPTTGLVPLTRRRPETLACWLGSDGWVELSPSTFAAMWSGVVVEVEARPDAGELVAPEPSRAGSWIALAAALGVALPLALGLAPPSNDWGAFLLASLLGPALGLAAVLPLVAAHLGSFGSMARWCPTTGRSSCAAVVQSRFGSVLGVPVADLALLYFVVRVFAVASAWLAGDPRVLSGALVWLAAAAVPVAIASVIVQWRVVGRFCRLCLGVQAALWIDAVVAGALAPAWELPSAPALEWLGLATALAIAGWIPLRRLLVRVVGSDAVEEVVVRQLRTSSFVRAAVAGATELPPRVSAATISFGDEDAPCSVTIVAKLRCPACALAVRELDRFVRMHPEELRAEIVVAPDEPGVSAVLGKILAEVATGRPDEARATLCSWYRDPQQDVAAWRDGSEVVSIEAHTLAALRTWMHDANVLGTPVIAIDGRPLPLGSTFEAVRAIAFDGGIEVPPSTYARASG